MHLEFRGPVLTHPVRKRWAPTQCSTVEGELIVAGLGKACRENDKDTYETPSFEKGRWKILLHTSDWTESTRVSDPRYIGIYLSACAEGREEEIRRSLHEFDVKLFVGDDLLATFSCDRNVYLPDGDGWGTKKFCRMSKLAEHPNLLRHDVILLKYMIKEYPEDSNDLPLKLTPPYAAMASAYAQLFDDPDTADVCFIIHHPSASDPGPQFIHAHSKILAARATYFATMFKEGYLEAKTEQDEEVDACSDTSSLWEGGIDSDYDDGDCFDVADIFYDGADEPTASTRGALDDAAQDYGTVAHVVSRDGPILDAIVSLSPAASEAGGRANSVDEGVASTPDGSKRAIATEPASLAARRVRYRKAIHVHDVAYRTYKSLIFYLYTGSIAFAPPTSMYRVERAAALAADPSTPLPTRAEFNDQYATVVSTLDGGRVPWTSAKSMYKLCDRIDLPELMDAAAEHIKLSLTPDTVAEEVSSTFSAAYPYIRAAQAEYLEAHYAEVCMSEAFERLFMKLFGDAGVADVWLNLFARLRLPHADDT